MLYQLSYSRPRTAEQGRRSSRGEVASSENAGMRGRAGELVPGQVGARAIGWVSADRERVLLRGAGVLAARARHLDEVVAFLERHADQPLLAPAAHRVRSADHV